MSIELLREAAPKPSEPSAIGSEFEQFVRQLCGRQSYEPSSLRAWLDLAEAWKITRTLRECRGNRSAAARALGIGRRTLYAKMEKLEITPSWKVCNGPSADS
jgi:DNA-binding NtrC family response regulator